MIPGEASRLRLASTHHGSTASIAARTFSGPRPAGEQDAALGARRLLPVAVVLLEPRKVLHVRDHLVPAEEDAVARAVAVLLRVELGEIGAGLLGLADEDADGEHRLGHGKRRGGATGALREDEAREVGARLGGDGDVLLARQAADLHIRPPQQVGQRRGRVRRAHERRADQHGVGTGELGGGSVGAVEDAALGDDDPVARSGGDEPELLAGGRSRMCRGRGR